MKRVVISLLVVVSACSAEVEPELGHDEDHADPAELFSATAEERLDEAKADGAGCSGIYVPDRGPFDGLIALTFDDGPNTVTTPQIMRILRERGLPATFFINGRVAQSEAARNIAEEIVRDPDFILANHSYSHPGDTLPGLSSENLAHEIDSNTDVLRAAGQFDNEDAHQYFRFPYGASNCRTAEAVRSRGYHITGWHIDSADWCFASGRGTCRGFDSVPAQYRSDMTGYVLSQARRFNGGILLFHDVHQNTADSLEEILDSLIAAGYAFTSLDDLSTFPVLNGLRPKFIGDECMQDTECTMTSNAFCLNGRCTMPCDGYCPDRDGYAPTFCSALDEDEYGAPGLCLSKSSEENDACEAYGMLTAVDRHIGTSSARPATAEVCLPVTMSAAP